MFYCYQVKLEFYVTRSFMYFYMYFQFLLFFQSNIYFLIHIHFPFVSLFIYLHDVVSLFSMNLAIDYVALFGVICLLML